MVEFSGRTSCTRVGQDMDTTQGSYASETDNAQDRIVHSHSPGTLGDLSRGPVPGAGVRHGSLESRQNRNQSLKMYKFQHRTSRRSDKAEGPLHPKK